MNKKEEFKEFLRNNPYLSSRVNEGVTTYRKLYETYDIYGETSLNFIKEFPHADIIKSKRIDALANNIYKSTKGYLPYSRCLTKAKKIKELANNSYPGIEVNSCEVNNLINIVDIIIYNSNKLNEVKQDIINLAKQTPYFNIINSKDRF